MNVDGKGSPRGGHVLLNVGADDFRYAPGTARHVRIVLHIAGIVVDVDQLSASLAPYLQQNLGHDPLHLGAPGGRNGEGGITVAGESVDAAREIVWQPLA